MPANRSGEQAAPSSRSAARRASRSAPSARPAFPLRRRAASRRGRRLSCRIRPRRPGAAASASPRSRSPSIAPSALRWSRGQLESELLEPALHQRARLAPNRSRRVRDLAQAAPPHERQLEEEELFEREAPAGDRYFRSRAREVGSGERICPVWHALARRAVARGAPRPTAARGPAPAKRSRGCALPTSPPSPDTPARVPSCGVPTSPSLVYELVLEHPEHRSAAPAFELSAKQHARSLGQLLEQVFLVEPNRRAATRCRPPPRTRAA